MAERVRPVKGNEKEFGKCMMRPRSRQAAAPNVRPELEGRVMSMLVGENSDWGGFCRSFKEVTNDQSGQATFCAGGFPRPADGAATLCAGGLPWPEDGPA